MGVLGGTFDPPHRGHLAIANAAIESLNLDEVVFLPNNRNPLKRQEKGANPQQRMAMVKLLIRDQPKMAVSDIELTRGGLSYAVDTLSELQMVSPANYWFIVGSDALKELDQWKAPQRLLKMCRIAVINRDPLHDFWFPVNLPDEYRDSVDVVPMKVDPVSSSDIRTRLFARKDLAGLIPDPILDYIRANKLYQL